MKKKFLLTASTAILALGVLTACGDKKEEDKQEPAPIEQETNNETTPEAEDNGDAEAEDNGDAEGEDAEGENEEAPADGEEEEEAK